MKVSSEGKPLHSESAQNVNVPSKVFWHRSSFLFFVLGSDCHFGDNSCEAVALLPSLTHGWCEMPAVLPYIHVETSVHWQKSMELGSLGPPPSPSEPEPCCLYPSNPFVLTVQTGLFYKKGWKITVVAHLEQSPFSLNSPTPSSKGSLSVNEEEDVAHNYFAQLSLCFMILASFVTWRCTTMGSVRAKAGAARGELPGWSQFVDPAHSVTFFPQSVPSLESHCSDWKLWRIFFLPCLQIGFSGLQKSLLPQHINGNMDGKFKCVPLTVNGNEVYIYELSQIPISLLWTHCPKEKICVLVGFRNLNIYKTVDQ